MNNNLPKFKVFCASEQAETVHVGTIDSNNGDIILTCDCGRFLKLPAKSQGYTTADYQALIAEHKVVNEGQVSLQGSIDALEELAAAEEANETTPEATPQDAATDTQPEGSTTPEAQGTDEVTPDVNEAPDNSAASEETPTPQDEAPATSPDSADVVAAGPVS